METKHQVHNLIILDESGSMESVKKTIIQGFNEIVQTVKGIEKQFPEQRHYISLVSFNGLGNKLLHFIDPVDKLQELDAQRYRPDASTPLHDAMGFGINKLRQFLENQTGYNVLVTILTDGEENASREYSGHSIRALIRELKLDNWTFTYIGTDHDVAKAAFSLSITNTMTFQKNEAAMAEMFSKEKSSRHRYSQKIKDGEKTDADFYEDEKPA